MNQFQKYCLIIFTLCLLPKADAQYSFSGNVTVDSSVEYTLYLSIIENHRNLYRISEDQFINSTKLDSSGYFEFSGSNLPVKNRYYRLHIIPNGEDKSTYIYSPTNGETNFILFIANNTDSIKFGVFPNKIFGDITESTNYYSNAWIKYNKIKLLVGRNSDKHESDASKKLGINYYYSEIKKYCESMNDPLISLMAFVDLAPIGYHNYTNFLIDYDKDQAFYLDLLKQLEDDYPNTTYLNVYKEELREAEFKLKKEGENPLTKWMWILGLISILFLIFTFILIRKIKRQNKIEKREVNLEEELSPQEQKVVKLIVGGKSNKEISEELFISVSTVKTHINNIYSKLNVANRAELNQLVS